MTVLLIIVALIIMAGAFQLGVWFERDQHSELNVEGMYEEES